MNGVIRILRRLSRRRLLIGGAAAVAAVAASPPEAASATLRTTGGLAEVRASDGGRLHVRLRHGGGHQVVPAEDFPPDWTFEIGDLVAVRPATEETGPVAVPYVEVTYNEVNGRREVWAFSANGGSFLARSL